MRRFGQSSGAGSRPEHAGEHDAFGVGGTVAGMNPEKLVELLQQLAREGYDTFV
jgi:hypothetical protein